MWTGEFKLSSSWKDGKKFCGSTGSKWKFQWPADWVDQINVSNKFQVHYENWQRRETEKQGHCLWFIGGGPGCGKSRCLDEFPNILRRAAAGGCEDLQRRLQNMFVFKISFGNGTKTRNGLPDRSLIPAHMAYQLQESSLSWTAFIGTAAAQNMTVDNVVDHLRNILGIADARDLTILLLIDSLQDSGSALETVMSTICELTNCSVPFFMIACTATIQINVQEFLYNYGQPFVCLSPPPISEPMEITKVCEGLSSYGARLTNIMIQDMDGHGRALEYLLETLKVHNLDSVPASTVMKAIKTNLKDAYIGWNPLPCSSQASGLLGSIIGRAKLRLYDLIPGTTVTVDQILRAGFFRYDIREGVLSVAYIWISLISDWIDIPELKAIIKLDEKYFEKIQHGSPSLSLPAFEEFWCYFRAVRSRSYGDKIQMEWNILHSGAIVTDEDNIKFENNHLSCMRAVHQFETRSSNKGVIKVVDGTDWNSRDLMLDKVILNCPESPSGDSMVVLKLSNGEYCSEAHQCKIFDAPFLTVDAVGRERQKAADSKDFFVLVCSGKLCGSLDELPARTAIVDADCFEQYFGPFAGRALRYKHSGPWM